MLPQLPPKSKPQPPDTDEEPGYVRCAGCFCWTNRYTVDLTAEGYGFALCDQCENFCDEWHFDEIIRNICSYTGGEVWTL